MKWMLTIFVFRLNSISIWLWVMCILTERSEINASLYSFGRSVFPLIFITNFFLDEFQGEFHSILLTINCRVSINRSNKNKH